MRPRPSGTRRVRRICIRTTAHDCQPARPGWRLTRAARARRCPGRRVPAGASEIVALGRPDRAAGVQRQQVITGGAARQPESARTDHLRRAGLGGPHAPGSARRSRHSVPSGSVSTPRGGGPRWPASWYSFPSAVSPYTVTGPSPGGRTTLAEKPLLRAYSPDRADEVAPRAARAHDGASTSPRAARASIADRRVGPPGGRPSPERG